MTCLGLIVYRGRLEGLAFTGRRAVWREETPWDSQDSLRTAVTTLISMSPTRLRHARVAFAADLCRLRVLSGLPRLRPAQLRSAVALRTAQWFVGGAEMLADACYQRRSGTNIGAAVDQGTVEAIVAALADAGVRVASVTSLTALLAGTLPDGTHRLRLGKVSEDLEVANGEVTALRVFRPDAEPAADVEARIDAPPVVTTVPPTVLIGTARLDLRPRGLKVRGERRALRAATSLIAGAMLCAVIAGATWSVRLSSAVRAGRAELAVLEERLRPSRALQGEIMATERATMQLLEARENRSGDLELLAVLTAALDDSTRLTRLVRDSGNTVELEVIAMEPPSVLAAIAETGRFQTFSPLSTGEARARGGSGHLIRLLWTPNGRRG